MTTPHALVRMRYRPSGDVLVGQVDLRDADPQTPSAAIEPDLGDLAAATTEQARHIEQLDAFPRLLRGLFRGERHQPRTR